jgi:hypothetical protein
MTAATMSWIADGPDLAPGTVFEVREGTRIVARGEVISAETMADLA